MTTYIVSKKPNQIEDMKNSLPDNYSDPIIEWPQLNSKKIKKVQNGDIVIGLQIDEELRCELEKIGAKWIKHSIKLATAETNENKIEETTDYTPFQVDILFSIVAVQAIPNIMHAINQPIRPKKIVLLYTEDYLQKAEYLLQTIEGIKDFSSKREGAGEVDIVLIKNNKTGTSYNQAYDEISSIYDSYYKDGITIGLNATCGTKMISFAATCVFKEKKAPVFYVDDDKLYILPIQPDQEKDIFIKIDGDIGIKNFLASYGKRLDDIGNSLENKKYINFQDRLIKDKKLISEVCKIYNSKISKKLSYDDFDKNTLDLLSHNDFINIKGDNFGLRYSKNSPQGEFILGGWLREYVFRRLQELEIKNIEKNILLKNINDDAGTRGYKNEIDITIMHDNNLYFIICKTETPENMNTNGIYESFAKIKSINALRADLMIFSIYEPSNPNDKQRAENLGIKFITGPENIKKRLASLNELFKR